MGSVDRSTVRNPSPPPGYVRPNPHIGLRPDLAEIDGQIFKFLALTIESGILEDSNPLSDFSVPDSDDDDVQYVPVAPKVPPVIDLDVECLNLSDGEIPDAPEEPSVIEAEETYPEKQPVEPKEILEARPPLKAVKKDITPPSTKVKKHHSKKEKVVDYSSDSSTESSHSKKKKKPRRKHRSRSPSSAEHEDSDNKDHKYGSTDIKQEDNLFGSFHCSVCKLTMNAVGSFESHLNGKRHLKAMKAQRENVAQAVESSLVNISCGKSTRYPVAPANVIRMRVPDTAVIQRIVEERVENPCPGLQNVIEIQEHEETHYYCSLCDAPCSTNSIIPHLRGRKHQLSCLEFFDQRAYLSIKDKSNREIDNVLHRLLRSIQKSQGLGRITVERDMERKDYRDYSIHADRAPRRENIPGPSHRYDEPGDKLPESFQKTMIPDTSKSDFYCKICDSHMNNINMWEAHIRGKRHLKNVKKAPGEGPSKTKSYPLPNVRAYVMDELELLQEPVVGLQFIRETRNPEVGGAMYNCFPCGACLTQLDIVDHILTQKHRTKFLEKIEHPYWLTMKQMDIQGSRLGSIIEEACADEQEINGSGSMEVHMMKSAGAIGSGRW